MMIEDGTARRTSPRQGPRPRRPATRAILDDHPTDDAGEVPYLNRELSWLGFDERVLALAGDTSLPLLERTKFLAIFHENLDEFFQVRVAGLMEQVAAGTSYSPADGMSPPAQLAAIRRYVTALYDEQARLFHDELLPALAEEHIRFASWSELDERDREHLHEVFSERVFPVLTPLAVDPAHPFPYISNLSINLAVEVRDPDDDETRFARVKVPPILPRFVVMPDGERVVPLEQVIAAHLEWLFPGHEIVSHHPFRVTRNADLVVEEEEADDLLLAIESELNRRRFGRVVRLEVEPDMPEATLDLLCRELEVTTDEIHVTPGPLGLDGLWALYDLDRPDLCYPAFTPATPPRLLSAVSEDPDIFAALRQGDVLVHHPYDSFATSVQAFIDAAARDPDVLAIKMTLYRTSGPGSPIIRSLLEAAEAGKQVVVLVELKARFDEERNIEWARVLEESGVHVAYGVVGLKTHTKTALVVRTEDGTLRRYAHIGTGNYNDRTARVYEDLGLLTSDPDLGADLSDLFNVLTGYGHQESYRRLLVAPSGLRPRILQLIGRETDAGPNGHIVLKLNSLVDAAVIDALYAASRAGTRVDLIVRGICSLRPGIPGLSENIRARSIVGRYLEHSRIYRFGTEERGYDHLIGSADLMPRNLDRRVEAVVPVDDTELQQRLEEILGVLFSDDQLAWELRPDGSWVRVEGDQGIDAQQRLQELAHARTRERRSGADGNGRHVRAAGGVVLRHLDTDGPAEVLVVHRPRYDDWSLPKGKLDSGESWATAAIREIHEETGVTVRLGRELSTTRYTDRDGRPKTVRWWLATPVDGRPADRPADREIDAARWATTSEARALLTYDADVELLDEALRHADKGDADEDDGDPAATT
jgi:polyphosphate kinase